MLADSVIAQHATMLTRPMPSQVIKLVCAGRGGQFSQVESGTDSCHKLRHSEHPAVPVPSPTHSRLQPKTPRPILLTLPARCTR